jgi:hypothetical protein
MGPSKEMRRVHGRASGFVGLAALAALLGCGGSGGGFSTSVPGGSSLESLSPTQTTQLCDDLDAYFVKLEISPSACQMIGALATVEYAAANPTATEQALQQFCAGAVAACATPPTDAGLTQASAPARTDAGRADAGRTDAGRTDAGHADAGRTGAGRADAGRADAGRADGGFRSGVRCGSTAGCTATVSQVSACASDSGSALSKLAAMFPACGMVTPARLATLQLDAGLAKPTSCAVLDNECPGFSPTLSLRLSGY